MTALLPGSLRPAIDSIGGALRLDLSTGQVECLLAYLALLAQWNAAYNLTAIRDPAAMVVQHLADCLAVIGPLRRHSQGRPLRLLDVGSGAGLPGVVIAVLLPEIDVTCIDSVGKKAAFVRQVASELKLPGLHSVHGRVETLGPVRFDVVTSRAFASLADFVRLSSKALQGDGIWMAMKGKHPGAELHDLGPGVEVFHVEPLPVPGLNADRCLVWMRRMSAAAPGFTAA